MYFNEEHRLFRQGLRDFLDQEVMPYIDEWEEQERIPKDIWRKMGEMGYLGLDYPEAYGGVEADFFFSVVFLEEIAKCFSGGFAAAMSVQQYMSSTYIYKYGSELLKKQYLTKAISGELVCSIAITEPGAGSDVANIQTRAELKGDHYLVNGAKTFITNAYYGDFLVTVVKTDPEAGIHGISLLVIDRNAEGVSARKLRKLGWHASDTAELNFDNVKVPIENLVGKAGQGFFYLMGGLQVERLAGAVLAVAGCEKTLDYALQYMSERSAFGRPINKFQVLRHRVAQMAAEIEATKAFVYQCCKQHEEGAYIVKECSMAKLLASELSDKVTYQCLQFFGGYGYMEEYKAARMFRDSRIGTIGGGTSEIMREIIAKMVIDDKSYAEAGRAVEKEQAASASKNGTPSNGHRLDSHHQLNDSNIMSVESIMSAIQERAKRSSALGNTLKFDLGEQKVFLDGTGAENRVSAEDKEADCTVSVAQEDMEAILNGMLNPMNAFMSGKIKVKGDMGVAMKLQGLLG